MPPETISDPPAAPPLQVGPASPGDIEQVVALYLGEDETDRQMYHPLPFSPWWLRFVLRGLVIAQRRSRRWVRLVPRAAASFLVGRLEDHGPVVAFGHLRFRRSASGLLVAETGYFVNPKFRRRGFGVEFKVGLIAEARRFGAQRVEALIDPRNIASVRLNQRLGFRFAPDPVPDRRTPHSQLLVAQLDLGPGPAPAEASAPAPVDASSRARV